MIELGVSQSNVGVCPPCEMMCSWGSFCCSSGYAIQKDCDCGCPECAAGLACLDASEVTTQKSNQGYGMTSKICRPKGDFEPAPGCPTTTTTKPVVEYNKTIGFKLEAE